MAKQQLEGKSMQKEEKKVFKTNKFYFYALKYAETATSDAEIRNIDMTEEFWNEIEQEIINDELVNININAKVRMSKSTSGIAIGKKLHTILKKHKSQAKGRFGIKNIARDEQEFSLLMRDDSLGYTVIVTDEINSLENTGENVTVERALLNDFSNIQASRYVHRVSCSPYEVTDPNADVFLEIISVDRKNGITHAHLYYRMFRGGNKYLQLLGYVNIDVSDVIKIWVEKAKDHLLKPQRSRYDNKILNELRKKDFYVEYMVRKHEKMELITKHGIMRPRMLGYASMILEVETKLRPLTRLNILNKTTIRNFVKKHCRERKIPTTIVGESLMTDEVEGVLSLWKNYFQIMNKLKELDNRRHKLEEDEYELRKNLIEDTSNEIMAIIQEQLKELEHYKEINAEYHS